MGARTIHDLHHEGGADALRDRPAPGLGWTIGCGIAVAVAIAFRFYALGRLPGINGDEAWYGVQVEHWLSGAAVQWRTPSGNIPGPLHLGLLTLLQLVAKPSFVLLRLPSVLSSLAALGLTYFTVRRHFDRPTAATALVVMAVLPVNLVYARFGWDPSHSGLVDMGAAAFALAGNPLGCALVFALALAVHPTNIFLAPFLVLAFWGGEMERRGRRGAAGRTALLIALLCVALGVISLTTSGSKATIALPAVLDRLFHPDQWAGFVLLYLRLLTGDVSYVYITGTGLGAARGPAEMALAGLLFGLLVVAAAALSRQRVGREAGVLLGWLASLVLFFLLAGNQAISPHFERYALCLIVPTVLALALLLRELGERGAHWGRPFAVVGVAAALALAGFWQHYFVALETTGSASQETFWTGAREPKRAAFERIAAASPGGARIVAENWWLYWPIAYLAAGHPFDVDSERPSPGPVPAGGTYWVVFPDGDTDRWLAAGHSARSRWDIAGAGRPVSVRVWWVPRGVMLPPR